MYLMKSNKELGSSQEDSHPQPSQVHVVDETMFKQCAQYPPFWPLSYFPYFDYVYPNQYLPFMHPYGLPFLPPPLLNQTLAKKTQPTIIKIQESEEELVIQAQPPSIHQQIEKVEEKKESLKEEIIQMKKQDGEKLPNLPIEESSQPFVVTKFVNDVSRNAKNKEICLQNLLKYHILEPNRYQEILNQKNQKNSLFSQIVKIFNTKITSFKKSKQEMIKIIIRKTQRFYKAKNNCKKDNRFKKYGGFKSMNSVYLQKLFSDSVFVDCFNQVLQSFMKEFEEENTLKLTIFLEKVIQASTWEQMKMALISIDQKNKMPWPRYWVIKFQNVLNELQSIYIQHNSSKMQTKPKKKH